MLAGRPSPAPRPLKASMCCPTFALWEAKAAGAGRELPSQRHQAANDHVHLPNVADVGHSSLVCHTKLPRRNALAPVDTVGRCGTGACRNHYVQRQLVADDRRIPRLCGSTLCAMIMTQLAIDTALPPMPLGVATTRCQIRSASRLWLRSVLKMRPWPKGGNPTNAPRA